MGTVHIPVGTVTTANFDWNFVIAGVTFDFTAPVDLSISPNGLNSCAVEATTSADCDALDNNGFSFATVGDMLFMTNLFDHRYDLFLRPREERASLAPGTAPRSRLFPNHLGLLYWG